MVNIINLFVSFPYTITKKYIFLFAKMMFWSTKVKRTLKKIIDVIYQKETCIYKQDISPLLLLKLNICHQMHLLK